MTLLPGVCLGPKNNPLNLAMIRISLRSGSNTQSLLLKFTVSDKTRQVYSANTMPGHQHTEVSTHTCTHQTHLTT